MIDIDYGNIHINLDKIMERQEVSINRLALRAELQRSQLKKYIRNEVKRVDLSVLCRLCYVLQCSLDDLIEYVPPEKK